MSRRLLALVAALALCVQGCASTDDYRFPSETSTPAAAGDLSAERRAAGIEDCPVGDPSLAAVVGGLPELTLGCLGGGGPGTTLAQLPRGPMVVNFWAQWCGPCRDEAPHLAAVAEATRGKVQFVGVDRQDPQPGLAIDFAEQVGWRYPQLVDQDNLSAGPPLQAKGLPYTLLVDADGRIVHRIPGPVSSEQELRDLLATHLGVDR